MARCSVSSAGNIDAGLLYRAKTERQQRSLAGFIDEWTYIISKLDVLSNKGVMPPLLYLILAYRIKFWFTSRKRNSIRQKMDADACLKEIYMYSANVVK